jgi:hypothetical protein
MIVRFALAAVALAAATGATAQTVSTDCYTTKHRVHCSSSVRPDLSDSIAAAFGPIIEARRRRENARILAEGERLLAEQRAAQAALDRNPATQAPDFQRWRVTVLIANKDCPGAHRYAAETKNPVTINRVAEFCGPPTL